MSDAPRTIWAHGLCMGELGKPSNSVASYRHGSWETREGCANHSTRYHHDEVVRELAETLERAEMMMRMRGCLEMANECAAALARIAQEGKR